MRAAGAASGGAGDFERGEILPEGVVSEQSAAKGFADAGDKLDGFEGLETADDAAERAEDTGFAAVGYGAGGGWLGEKAAVAGRARGGIEDGDLALKFINAAVDERATRQDGGVVVEVAGGERIGAVDDEVVGGEERKGVGGGDALGVLDDLDERIGGAEAAGGGDDLAFADGGVVVEKLTLEVVRLDAVEVGDAEGAEAGGGEVKGSGTAEAAGADHEDARGGELLLAGDADLIEEDVAAVTREFVGRKGGRSGGHAVKRAGGGRVANEIAPGAGGGRSGEMRFIGIDYGTRRLGLAYGDELGVATPLPAQVDADEARRWAGMVAMVKARRATDLVLGYPLNKDGTAGFKAKEVDAFAAKLKAELGLPVHLVDETLTSHEAESTISKVRRREVRASGIVDSRAATLILQDYLDQKFPQDEPHENR